MSTDPLPDQTPPAKPAADAGEARIDFLFRTTLRQGRIHPLQHLLVQHRAAQAAGATLAPKVQK